MRIVAGEWRGRTLVAPKGTETRPTSDRVREALFSALAARWDSDLSAASVLDAFAGSGALGLEALSRGAATATLVDLSPAAVAAQRVNVEALRATTRTRITAGDVFVLARRGALPGAPFSLLLLDPPYRIDQADVGRLITVLCESAALVPGAAVVWEHATNTEVVWPTRLTPVVQKRYGSTTVDIGIAEGGDTTA